MIVRDAIKRDSTWIGVITEVILELARLEVRCTEHGLKGDREHAIYASSALTIPS